MVTLPMGSRNITRDLVSLNHLEEHAESIKRSIGIVSVSDAASRPGGQHSIEQPELNSYISARAGEIIANVTANIEYAGLTPADLPSGIVTVGGGARLKGLSDMIAGQSGMKVRMGTTPRNIRLSDTSISADDITDVVSLLIAAAANNPVDCLTPVVNTGYEVPVTENGYGPGGTPLPEDDDDEIRIGREDDDIIDENDFIGSRKEKSRAARDKEIKRHVKDERPGGAKINRIKSMLSKMFRDDEIDRFEDEE